jgi:hypothetical protein
MDEKPAIRMVNTSAEDLQNCNVEHLVRVFGGVSQQPGKAKLLRGLVFLGFPSAEAQRQPNWRIPEVRAFIRKLDREMPYFSYYLTADAPFGFLRTYMYCLLDPEPDGGIQPQKFQLLVQRLERDVRAFCDRIADRPEPVIEGILTNLPAEIVHNVPELRRASLRTLLPVLEAIVRTPDAGDQVKRPAFREAETLLGTTVAACGSEREFVARVTKEAQARD